MIFQTYKVFRLMIILSIVAERKDMKYLHDSRLYVTPMDFYRAKFCQLGSALKTIREILSVVKPTTLSLKKIRTDDWNFTSL